MGQKKKTRPCAVEKHPQAKKIIKEIAEGAHLLDISKRYGIHRNALRFYRDHRLSGAVVKAAERKSITDAEQLFQTILKAVDRMEKLSDSCDEYLTDPNNPEVYYMGPQAWEIDVIWYEMDYAENGKILKTRHRDSLQYLLSKLEENNPDMVVEEIKTRHTDPRMLLVKASETLTKQMDVLVTAWKAIDNGRSAFLNTPAWQQIVKIILDVTEKYPEVRRQIANELSRIC